MRVFLLPSLICSVAAVGPIQKVLSLLADLKGKVVAEGETETAQYEKYTKWCEEESSEKGYAIKTGESKVDDLKANIEEYSAQISSLSAKIEELGASISQNESDLKGATQIREQEHADFEKTEKELVDTVDTLVRAGSVLRKAGLNGSPGTKAQLKAMFTQIAGSLSVIMDAAFISSEDKSKLAAFVQNADSDDESFEPPTGAPKAAAYESHSTGILDTLAELKVKAEQELADSRKDEMTKKHNFEMLAQSLTDQISTLNRDLKQSRADKAKNTEALSIAQGDLASTSDRLSSDKQYLADLTQQCGEKAASWEERVKARKEELSVLDKAVEILSADKFTAAAGRRLPQLLQVRTAVRDNGAVRKEVAEVLSEAANRLHSVGLSQLAVRTRSGDDPFVKIRAMISDMVASLQKQAAEESDRKAYCDEENAKSSQKRDEFSGKVDNLSTRVDEATAGTAKLKEEVAELSSEVAASDKAMAEATALRQEESSEYASAMADYEESQNAISAAISVLQEHFAEKPSLLQNPAFGGDVFEGSYQKRVDGATGIIGILEVAQSDFARMEAEGKATESRAQKEFTKMKQESEVNRAKKTTAVKSKEGEITRVANLINDLKADRDGAQQELDAVLTYIEKLKSQCEHKPMSFQERAARRASEIESLKTALDILENKVATSFLQKRVD